MRDYAWLYATFIRVTSAEQLLSVLHEPAHERVRVNRAVRPADVEATGSSVSHRHGTPAAGDPGAGRGRAG